MKSYNTVSLIAFLLGIACLIFYTISDSIFFGILSIYFIILNAKYEILEELKNFKNNKK